MGLPRGWVGWKKSAPPLIKNTDKGLSVSPMGRREGEGIERERAERVGKMLFFVKKQNVIGERAVKKNELEEGEEGGGFQFVASAVCVSFSPPLPPH